jgi:hypothetical protein
MRTTTDIEGMLAHMEQEIADGTLDTDHARGYRDALKWALQQ